MANRPLPCVSYGSFKMFKISASDFETVGMCRRKRACSHNFLTTVTEGVVHGVSKVVARSSFSVIRRHKASGGKWTFCHCVTRSYTNLRR